MFNPKTTVTGILTILAGMCDVFGIIPQAQIVCRAIELVGPGLIGIFASDGKA